MNVLQLPDPEALLTGGAITRRRWAQGPQPVRGPRRLDLLHRIPATTSPKTLSQKGPENRFTVIAAPSLWRWEQPAADQIPEARSQLARLTSTDFLDCFGMCFNSVFRCSALETVKTGKIFCNLFHTKYLRTFQPRVEHFLYPSANSFKISSKRLLN
jgi:hypothetical protein